MSDVRAGQRFALVLREAIRVSGLTLDALQRRLADIGVHVGRSTQVWEIRITDDAGRLVGVSRCTIGIVASR